MAERIIQSQNRRAIGCETEVSLTCPSFFTIHTICDEQNVLAHAILLSKRVRSPGVRAGLLSWMMVMMVILSTPVLNAWGTVRTQRLSPPHRAGERAIKPVQTPKSKSRKTQTRLAVGKSQSRLHSSSTSFSCAYRPGGRSRVRCMQRAVLYRSKSQVCFPERSRRPTESSRALTQLSTVSAGRIA